jgi:hypothetical protein
MWSTGVLKALWIRGRIRPPIRPGREPPAVSSDARYRPGVCNIGASERRRRYRYAAVALVAAVAYFVAVVVTDAPAVLLVGLFVPLSLGAEWALQARRSFCAGLALTGGYSFDDTDGEVTRPADRRADVAAGLLFACLGIVAGAVGTAVAYVAVALF